MAESFLMEACVDSVESAINAERGGAGRLELCSSLLEGGLTPSLGLLQVVKQYVKTPVYVMIRPRGGDFLYSDQEVEVMRKDIELMKSHRADGLVLGALTEDGRVDAELCMEFLVAARPLPVTFHRAFDMVHDPVVALETLISLGFERLLTSGCENSALEGLPLIKRLVDQAKGRIAIMPGGGITERNLQRILEGSGAQEFHGSARSSKDSAMKFRNTSVTMGAAFSAPEYGLKVTDANKRHITHICDGESPKILTCNSGSYHCLFCIYKGEKYQVENHIKGHSTVKHGEFTIVKCGLSCRTATHYHCFHCSVTIINRAQFLLHLNSHEQKAVTKGHPPPPAQLLPTSRLLAPPPAQLPPTSGLLAPPPAQLPPTSRLHPPPPAQLLPTSYLLIPASAQLLPTSRLLLAPCHPAPEKQPQEPQEKHEATQDLKEQSKPKKKLVTCPHCSLKLNKNNYKTHVRRKHKTVSKENVRKEKSK